MSAISGSRPPGIPEAYGQQHYSVSMQGVIMATKQNQDISHCQFANIKIQEIILVKLVSIKEWHFIQD